MSVDSRNAPSPKRTSYNNSYIVQAKDNSSRGISSGVSASQTDNKNISVSQTPMTVVANKSEEYGLESEDVGEISLEQLAKERKDKTGYNTNDVEMVGNCQHPDF
jgi:hypothetical protein